MSFTKWKVSYDENGYKCEVDKGKLFRWQVEAKLNGSKCILQGRKVCLKRDVIDIVIEEIKRFEKINNGIKIEYEKLLIQEEKFLDMGCE